MCIMEVRAGQRSSTIAQAMAHNLSTIERDLDMFRPLAEARGDAELLANLETGHAAMKVAYQSFLACFASEIAADVASGSVHEHAANEEGNERIERHADHQVIADAMAVATHRAERYEER